MITSVFIILLVSLIIYFIHVANKINQVWLKKGIKHKTPHLFFGNSLGVYTQRKYISTIFKEICQEFPDEPIVGFYDFTQPSLIVKDAEYVEKVLIKDFIHFMNVGCEINEEKNPMDAQLFSMVGKKWRAFRYKISPIFTSGKLKNMFETMTDCGNDFDIYLKNSSKNNVDMKLLMTRFSIDIVGSAVFGIQPNVLHNPNSKFCTLAVDLFNFGFWGSLKMVFLTIFPTIGIKMGLSFNNPEAIKYFSGILKDTFHYRRKNNIQRNDFIQLLMALKEKEKIEIQTWDPNDDYLKSDEIPNDHESYEITDNILMAQAYSFLTIGHDAIGITETYTLLELSLNPDIQEKTRNEIKEQIKLNNGLTYAALKNMMFLEKVIKETLRLHSITAQLYRVCNKDYTFPNGFTIKEKETLRIPVDFLHMNPDYFPEPDVFKPERFDIAPKPGTYLPFGDGPRICIAMRFALLLVKFGLAKVLMNYKVKLNPNTKLPYTPNPTGLLRIPEKPLLFDIEECN